MIAKHVSMRSLGKSSFASLVAYLADTQSKEHRLAEVRATNCEAGSLRDAVVEVLATQNLNKRAVGDKTYHLIVSFRSGEQPAPTVLRAVEDRICAGLGFGEHQRISAVHTDTDNVHVHIAINKIHPKRHTMHEPYYPHLALANLCETLEQDFGLERDNHLVQRRRSEGRAMDMERHSGVESLLSWIRRECATDIRAANSWIEVHRALQHNDLKLRVQANGLVFVAGNGSMVKASAVAREFSKMNMEARLGAFEPVESGSGVVALRQYNKEPLSLAVDTTELYTKYKAEQQVSRDRLGRGVTSARNRKARLIDAAKRAHRLRRRAIGLLAEGRMAKKLMYAQSQKALRSEIQAINQQYQKERGDLHARGRRLVWADWLKNEAQLGNEHALAALRARAGGGGPQGQTLAGEGELLPGRLPRVDGITKKGTVVFRGDGIALRDDGARLHVSREATRDGLRTALNLAMQRFGSHIIVNGSAAFKAQIICVAADSHLPITFVDPALESRRQQLLAKESPYGGTKRSEHGARIGRSTGGLEQRPVVGDHAPSFATASPGPTGRENGATGGYVKSHASGAGRVPPPQGTHRLRTMSELGVVCLAGRSEVLLPSDVSRHLEQQGAQSDHTLRRGLRTEPVSEDLRSAGQLAADKYITEREEKRKKIFDIPRHFRYTTYDDVLKYGGIRTVDGQKLALLKCADGVMVIPVSQVTARRLARVALGDDVSISREGSIKTLKGRSR